MTLIKTIFATGLIAMSSLAICACSDDDDSLSTAASALGEFKVSVTDVALLGTEPKTVTVLSTSTPTVTTDADWLTTTTPVKSEGATLDIYTFDISAEVNPLYDERTATVTVKGGSETATISVTQYGAETVKINSVTPTGELEAKGGQIVINYSSTSEVSIAYPSWMELEKSRALTDDTYTLTYGGNRTGDDRGGDIVLTLVSDPTITAQVTVSQPTVPTEADMPSNALQLAAKMYAGVNIGNTMETPDREAAWNCPVVNRDYIRGLKTLGFNAVRVPCAWDSHVSDASTNTIDPAWLDRVDEVVGWIVDEGMYALVNIHWDGGWLEESCVAGYDEAVNQKQHDYWTQIATKLNHYDEQLIFSGMNEPGVQNSGSVTSKSIQAIMAYQQTFLDAVRATGGNNSLRVLVMSAPYTDISAAVAGAYKMPTDVVADRMMLEVHYYDPYQFVMMESDASWGKMYFYWGSQNHVDGSGRNTSSSMEETAVINQFKKMNTNYVSSGIPVILGEYCVTAWRQNTEGIDVDKWWDSRDYWTEVVTREAKNAGMVPFYWETGGDINRNNGAAIYPRTINALMNGAAEGVYPF